MFIMERLYEREIQRRPFRIHQSALPRTDRPLDDRTNTVLLACLKGMSLRD